MREIVDTKVEFPVWSDFAKIVNHRKNNREYMLHQLDRLYHKKLLEKKIMGVTFEGKIRIVRSLPNPPEYQDQTTEAKVGLIGYQK